MAEQRFSRRGARCARATKPIARLFAGGLERLRRVCTPRSTLSAGISPASPPSFARTAFPLRSGGKGRTHRYVEEGAREAGRIEEPVGQATARLPSGRHFCVCRRSYRFVA